MANHKPTIVIGLGGVGGRIVSYVAERLTPEDRKYIATVCLDTNVNDIKKLEGKGIDFIVQTSTDKTVKRYAESLEEKGKSVRDWLHDIPLLNERTMLKGAGQIRQLSRIAMLSAIDTDKFKALDDAIVKVNSAGSTYEEDVSVLIVGSIAGGTCAGIMVQFPLFVRQLLIQRSAAKDPNIRGLFIDASVTEPYQEGNPTKIRDTYANGYACIKEINGLFRYASVPGEDIPVRLEYYEPDRTVGGDGTNPIPYKYLFLIEKYNFHGKSVPGGARPENYEAMAANILMAQLSQIGDEAEGSEDNLIRGLIDTQGMNRYCGAGAINIEYPYADIREYISMRCAEDSVRNQWRKIDEEYLLDKKQQAQRARTDANYEEESFEDYYIRKFEDYSAKGSPDAFFRSLTSDLSVLGSKSAKKAEPDPSNNTEPDQEVDEMVQGMKANNETPTDRVNMAKSSIEELIKTDSEGNYFVSSAKAACRLEETDITAPEAEAEDGVVNRSLRAISEYTNAVRDNLSYGYDTASKIISIMHYDAGTGMSAPWIEDRHDYNIAHIIRGTHPIVSRYILMKLRDYAKKELEKAIESEQSLSGKLDEISTKDFDGDDLNGVQNAITVYNNIINGRARRGPILFGKKSRSTPLDDFAGIYVEAVRTQVETINRYHVAAFRHRVFDDVLNRINVLLQSYTIMFDSLPDVTRNISETVLELEEKHEEKCENVARFVFARKQHKRTAYYMTGNTVTTEELPEETKDKFAQEIYNLFTEYYQNTLTADEEERDFYRDEMHRNARNIFNSTILPSIKHAIGDVTDQLFDKGVLKAMEFEVLCNDEIEKHSGDLKGAAGPLGRMIKNGSYDLTATQIEKMQAIILEVLSRAEPFIGIDGDPQGKAVYWGVNPGIAPQDDEAFFDLVNVRPDLYSRVVNDDAFGVNELRCYRILYAVRPEDLKSYQDGSPAHRYYTQLVNDVIEKNKRGSSAEGAASPHLDKRWHMEAYLPEIDPRKETRNRRDDLLAVAELLAYGGVSTETYDEVIRWKYIVPVYPVDIYEGDRLAEVERKGKKSYVGLYRSMAFNPVIKRNTLDRIAAARKEDISGETDIEANILSHYAIRMLMEIPDILGIYGGKTFTVLDLIAEIAVSVNRERYIQLVEGIKGFILDYCRESCRTREDQPAKVYKDVMKALLEKSRPETLARQELSRIGELG